MIGIRTWSCIVLVLVLAWPLAARADDPTRTEDALAQSLFDDAVALMRDGHFEEACPKLAESQRLEPGGGTLINLAFCLEQLHRYATAYTAYNEALSASLRDGRKDRETAAREGLARVTPLLSRIVVRVPQELRALGVEVHCDGAPVREAAWGVAAPVDPGLHEVTADAKGKRPWKSTITIDRDGMTKDIVVGPLEDLPPAAVAPLSPPPPRVIEALPANRRRTAAFVAVGISSAFVVQGIVTGIVAIAKHEERNALCARGCTDEAYTAEDAANAFAWAATIGFGAALVGYGIAAVLALTSSAPARSTVALSFTASALRARF
jgi:hypothetical protein